MHIYASKMRLRTVPMLVSVNSPPSRTPTPKTTPSANPKEVRVKSCGSARIIRSVVVSVPTTLGPYPAKLSSAQPPDRLGPALFVKLYIAGTGARKAQQRNGERVPLWIESEDLRTTVGRLRYSRCASKFREALHFTASLR